MLNQAEHGGETVVILIGHTIRVSALTRLASLMVQDSDKRKSTCTKAGGGGWKLSDLHWPNFGVITRGVMVLHYA